MPAIPGPPEPATRALTLFPAIDIRGGRAVRLLQGDYERETRYDSDPLDAARRWVAGGARVLHVVDLDGARAGHPVNLEVIARIAADAGVAIQAGGGLRDRGAVAAVLAAGVERAVLGTSAQRDPAMVGELIEAHGAARIVVSVDARAGLVAVEGWERPTTSTVPDLIAELSSRGVARFVYTPVEVDGTLDGPGMEGLDAVATSAAAGGAELIYSGGVGSLEHLRQLAGLEMPALGGVIVGRALYEQRFSVGEAIAALGGGET